MDGLFIFVCAGPVSLAAQLYFFDAHSAKQNKTKKQHVWLSSCSDWIES